MKERERGQEKEAVPPMLSSHFLDKGPAAEAEVL